MNNVSLPQSVDGIDPAAEHIGSVVFVAGSKAGIGLPQARLSDDDWVTVGTFVGIRSGHSFVIGVVTEVTSDMPPVPNGTRLDALAKVDLMGEIRRDAAGMSEFHRGVSDYPAIGDPVVLMSTSGLQVVYRAAGVRTISIGTLHQDESVPARIAVDDLLNKHFAVLGTTGVGKSSGTAVILSEVLEARPDVRILLLDGHNEYGRCFGTRAHVVNSRNLKLPFWLFDFEEFVDVLYGGRPGVEEEIQILAETIPIAKSQYTQYRTNDRAIRRKGEVKAAAYTCDTPVPYTMQDLIALVDERMGKLENRAARMHYHRLMHRIETIRNDPRYGFMFENANVGGDTMGELLRQLFRLDPEGKPITVMQLAGLPAEVMDAVVCVLCRLAFNLGLWGDGAVPLLVVCEEAHRFASADRTTGFHPTRRALTRIVREGRKYGIFLGLVTQRPAELDPTVIAQCGTLFAMRMANERDQELLRSAVPDAAADLLDFVPSLCTREVVAFGEGVPVPVRMTFRDVPAARLPRSETSHDLGHIDIAPEDPEFVRAVVDRWRGADMAEKVRPDEPERPVEAPPARPPGPIDADIEQIRQRLLRRPLDGSGRAEPEGEPRSAARGLFKDLG